MLLITFECNVTIHNNDVIVTLFSKPKIESYGDGTKQVLVT